MRALGEALVREQAGQLPGRPPGRSHGSSPAEGRGGEGGGKQPGDAAGGAAERLAAACRGAGRALAAAGVPMGEALDALAGEWGSLVGGDPPFPAARALADAWGDGTLAWLHRLDCEDPMTGLAGPGHLRSRVGEVLRAVGHRAPPESGHALVVVDLRPVAGDPLVDAQLVARAGATVRSVFAGGETVATLGGARLGVLAGAHPWLERRARLLQRMLATVTTGEEASGSPPSRGVRVRVLPLPTDTEAAHLLLEDLIDHGPDTRAVGLPRGGFTA